MAAVTLSTLIIHTDSQAASFDAELVVAALDIQTEPGEPLGLEGLGFRKIALRFEFLPPLAKAGDALAAAHLLRIAGYTGVKDKGAPVAPLTPSKPEAEPTDLLWMDADHDVHVLRVAAVALAPTQIRRGAWFFRAAAIGIARMLADPTELRRRPSLLVHPDTESWSAVYA